MRRIAGDRKHLAAGMALFALTACGGAVRAHEQLPPSAATCEVHDAFSRDADSAVISFRASGISDDECALRVAAKSFRPWISPAGERWTVAIERRAPLGESAVSYAIVRRLRETSARDALDTGSVLLATEELDLVAYASARGDLTVVPLPWDRTYVLIGAAREPSGAIDLASVRVDARFAEPLPACAVLTPAGKSRPVSESSKRAIYLSGDRTARELAERIVGVAGASEAAGLPAAAFDEALRAGDDFAYILSMSRPDLCREMSALEARAPWIDATSLSPLIDTRAYAIMTRAREP
ncbi:MAG: hypothetical protein ACT4PJ_15795 [Gemmatimonadaceae bacterium]